MFLKHLGFFALPITNIDSLLPTALAAGKPVILTFLCFQLIGFVWSILIKQPEFVGVVNILKIVIR